MIQVSRDDALKGLRRFKRLAKQDILASSLTPNPEFWRVQAESRRKTYDELIAMVENEGVTVAYEYALKQYRELRGYIEGETNPEYRGQGLAYELFLEAMGADKETLSGTPTESTPMQLVEERNKLQVQA